MAKSFKMKFYEERLEDAKTHPYGSHTILYDYGDEDQVLLVVNPGTHHVGPCLGFGGHIFQFRTPKGEIIRSNNCWQVGRRSDIPKRLVNKFEVWRKDTTPVLIQERRKLSFNAAALNVLRDYPEHVKAHVSWGWRVAILHGGYIHYDGDSKGYSLEQALKYVTSTYMYRYDDEAWVEPISFFSNREEEEICKWIIANNMNKRDYTTMENVSAGRANMPNNSCIWDTTYDKEYKKWVEATLKV